MEQLTYNYIDKLLREHALQLEKSTVSPRWHITDKGKFGYGRIYGHLKYHSPIGLVKEAQLQHGEPVSYTHLRAHETDSSRMPSSA